MNQFTPTRLATVVLAFVLCALPASTAATTPETANAHVVSTKTLEIRACPRVSCTVRSTAPLGADLAITGEAQDGFVPIRYDTTTGFVSDLLVASDPSHPPFLVKGSPGCQRVAFLFNVGVGFAPDAGILDTLQEEDVPAAMFVMGWWAEQNPPLLRRMVDDGYLIGSHGYDAIELTSRSDEDVLDDLTHAASAIEQATGQPPAPYFTPYAAAIDDRVRSIVAGQGLLPVAWEAPAADYGPDVTEEAVYSRVMDGVYDGAIVEFHLDAEKSADTTGRALPKIIDGLRDRGYQFVTIPDMTRPC